MKLNKETDSVSTKSTEKFNTLFTPSEDSDPEDQSEIKIFNDRKYKRLGKNRKAKKQTGNLF